MEDGLNGHLPALYPAGQARPAAVAPAPGAYVHIRQSTCTLVLDAALSAARRFHFKVGRTTETA